MPRLPPDHVGRRVARHAETHAEPDGDHPVEVAFFYLVKTGAAPNNPDVETAAAIYAARDQRRVVDAAILAKATDDQLLRDLDLPTAAATAYRHLFFDRAVFRHALDAVAYVAELGLTRAEEAVYVTALRQGADVLLAKYRIGPPEAPDPREVIRRTLAGFYERSRAHHGQPLTSREAQEALKWGRAAVETAVALIDKGGNAAEATLKDLRLTLEVRDHTLTAEQAGVRLDEIVGG